MKKQFWPVFLALPWVCLVVWTLCLTYQRAHAPEVVVAITGYDPRDLLSGRYIAYQPDWARTDCGQFENGICPKGNFCRKARWGERCRFYVPETDAGKLDALFRARGEKELRFDVVYAYQKGKEPLAKRLLINRTDWQDYLQTNKVPR